VTDAQRMAHLLALFDAAEAIAGVDIGLDEEREPFAFRTLIMWASGKNLRVKIESIAGEGETCVVRTAAGSTICAVRENRQQEIVDPAIRELARTLAKPIVEAIERADAAADRRDGR